MIYYESYNSLNNKIVALHREGGRFAGCRANWETDYLGLELEGWEVGFVDFTEAEGIGVETFVSFDFDIIALALCLQRTLLRLAGSSRGLLMSSR